ncbi:hypothetical protein HaloA020_05960 [Halomonas sp. A020]|nr:hypothetical protein HaloA020_05960 [Halomonas sp. A020]
MLMGINIAMSNPPPPNKVADKTDSSPVIKKKKINKDEIITKTTNKELATKTL